MKARPKGRKGEQEAREEWTERLQRFASARTPKQKQAAIEPALKFNPGGTLRDMLLAWGYSSSARGRKPKGAEENGEKKTARKRLEEILNRLYGPKPSPVRSLNAKLSGKMDISVGDACRIISAMIVSWPTRLDSVLRGQIEGNANSFAEKFLRHLLSEISNGRSYEWTPEELSIRVFKLAYQERIGAGQFIQEAGEQKGALIVAAYRLVLLGDQPIEIIKQFWDLTSRFVGENSESLLIFVVNAEIFETDKNRFDLLYNLGLLSTATMAFALFQNENDPGTAAVKVPGVDWRSWRSLASRCCVVMRRPPRIDPHSGELLGHDEFDDLLETWEILQNINRRDEFSGYAWFDSQHVLPSTYPNKFDDMDAMSGADLYWDVLVKHVQSSPDGLDVQYFVPPRQKVAAFQNAISTDDAASRMGKEAGRSGTGRVRGGQALQVEEDFFYVAKEASPGAQYDSAQRAIYMAARGRLNLDRDGRHTQNLNAVAALRQIGFEVLPISIAISFLPNLLHSAATMRQKDTNAV